MQNHEDYMKECLTLAEKGALFVCPNPKVGSIIVKNSQIIGTGYHERFGGAHAEINALKNCKTDPKGATLYVNLEPCAHHGKTPPCSEAIINAGIKKVIIGDLDPNPQVNGLGIKKMQNAGIEVITGILKEESREMNNYFFYAMEKQEAFLSIKIALSSNYQIADKQGVPRHITGKESDIFVHESRAKHQAIMVSARTVKLDNPKLTVRHISGRQPDKIILDLSKSLDPNKFDLFKDKSSQIFVINSELDNPNYDKFMDKYSIVRIIVKEKKLNFKKFKKIAFKYGIQSIMIEPGCTLAKSLLESQIYDKLGIFIADKEIKKGISPINARTKKDLITELKINQPKEKMFGKDLYIEYIKT